jgi:hypothetical protein
LFLGIRGSEQFFDVHFPNQHQVLPVSDFQLVPGESCRDAPASAFSAVPTDYDVLYGFGAYLRRRLLVEDHLVTLKVILNDSPSARLVTATFLALLEMVRLGAVQLRHDCICSDIRIKKTSEFEQVMSQSISIGEQWT